MIPRHVSDFATQNAQWFPIVSITGPRQSGKSTLAQKIFDTYTYYNLEDDATYTLCAPDPADFIKTHTDRLIIDEAQRIPELFSAIQVASDKRNTSGQYVLSGSQNFLLLRQITQSLAGRVGIIRLLPLSYREAHAHNNNMTVDDFIITGGYPRLHATSMPSHIFYRNYITTYIERDVRTYIEAASIPKFRTFLRLCAHNTGSLLNISRLAADTGITRATAEAWLGILEASYIVFRLSPYHANLRKRLTKTPKIYFYDTGLLCHLLGIKSVEALRDSHAYGVIFENLVIQETLKNYYNNGGEPELFFYRDDNKREIDLVDATDPHNLKLIEIKSASTYRAAFTRSLRVIGDELDVPIEQRNIVWRGDNEHADGIALRNAHTYFTA